MPHKENFQDAIRTIEMAHSEIEIAVTCREAWIPAAYDKELHRRLSHSYAGHTFMTIRQTLQREFILALCRIWDTNQKSIRLSKIWEGLRHPEFWNEVVAHRAREIDTKNHTLLEHNLSEKREKIIFLISKYQGGGSCELVLKGLRKQRHENLAHRNIQNVRSISTVQTVEYATDDEILTLYEDTKLLVQLLLALFKATHYDFNGLSKVFEHHAKFFWNGVRSEKNPGHPEYVE